VHFLSDANGIFCDLTDKEYLFAYMLVFHTWWFLFGF